MIHTKILKYRHPLNGLQVPGVGQAQTVHNSVQPSNNLGQSYDKSVRFLKAQMSFIMERLSQYKKVKCPAPTK